MADYRLDLIAAGGGFFQDSSRVLGDFNGVSVTFLQQQELVPLFFQEQFL